MFRRCETKGFRPLDPRGPRCAVLAGEEKRRRNEKEKAKERAKREKEKRKEKKREEKKNVLF